MSSPDIKYAFFRKRNLKVKRDNSLRKMSSWTVLKDPKGTKKTEVRIERAPSPEKIVVKRPKIRIWRKKRKVSQLRSSPSRPRGDSGSSDDGAGAAAASSANLRSPRRRAPRVPGLNELLSPQPPADTPTRMRARRRSGRPSGQSQLRCRNAGCPDSAVTFSTEGSRRRHEQRSCIRRVQVLNRRSF